MAVYYIYICQSERDECSVYISERERCVAAHFVTPARFVTCGDKSCRKVHSPHVLSSLRQQRSISLSSLDVRVCVLAYALSHVLFLLAKEYETEILYCFE